MSSNPGTPRFSPAQLLALKSTGTTFDVSDPAIPNLLLRVGPNGAKRWLFRYQWKGKQTRIAIGRFPETSLAEARELTITHQNQISRGIDPRNASRPILAHADPANGEPPRAARRSPRKSGLGPVTGQTPPHDPLSISKPDDKTSVHFLAYEYVEFHVKRQREGSREVVRILKKDVLPYWQKRDARTISSREIVERLDAIVARGAPVMAN
jgi:hypothetical protein